MVFKIVETTAVCVRTTYSISTHTNGKCCIPYNLATTVGDKAKNNYITLLEDEQSGQLAFQLSQKPLHEGSVKKYDLKVKYNKFEFNLRPFAYYFNVYNMPRLAQYLSYTTDAGLIVFSKESFIKFITRDDSKESMLSRKRMELQKKRGLKVIKRVK